MPQRPNLTASDRHLRHPKELELLDWAAVDFLDHLPGIGTLVDQTVPEPGGDKSISIERLEGLIALVQAGVLEIHLRGSTIDHLEEADRLVFDLDPGPGVEWPEVIAAAREVRQRFRDLKLESFVKTTGGKGLHVVLPIGFAPWEEAKEFCRRTASAMAADSPGRYTATAKKAVRNHRIYIDYLRNSREATAITPYSTRARASTTVATPLSWDELGSQKTPNGYTVLICQSALVDYVTIRGRISGDCARNCPLQIQEGLSRAPRGQLSEERLEHAFKVVLGKGFCSTGRPR